MLWSGVVALEVDEVEPVDATELLWPVVSVEEVLLELGLVLAVDELGAVDELLAVLEGVDDWSAYVPLVPCAVLLLEVDGLVDAVELLEVPAISVLEVGLVDVEAWSDVVLWPVEVLPNVEPLEVEGDWAV